MVNADCRSRPRKNFEDKESGLAASIFHLGTYTVGDVKKFLSAKKIPVRL
jgi:imidazole glycerol phosphate synthase subunit HisF